MLPSVRQLSHNRHRHTSTDAQHFSLRAIPTLCCCSAPSLFICSTLLASSIPKHYCCSHPFAPSHHSILHFVKLFQQHHCWTPLLTVPVLIISVLFLNTPWALPFHSVSNDSEALLFLSSSFHSSSCQRFLSSHLSQVLQTFQKHHYASSHSPSHFKPVPAIPHQCRNVPCPLWRQSDQGHWDLLASLSR